MTRIIKASVRYTQNLRNYESCSIELGTERSLNDDEDLTDALRQENDFLLDEVLDAAKIAVDEINKIKNS